MDKSTRNNLPLDLPLTRQDWYGVIFLMAYADGYVMVRRPGCFPFAMKEKTWKALAASEGEMP